MRPLKLRLFTILANCYLSKSELTEEDLSPSFELANKFLSIANGHTPSPTLLKDAITASRLYARVLQSSTFDSHETQYILISSAMANYIAKRFDRCKILLQRAITSELTPEFRGIAYLLLGKVEMSLEDGSSAEACAHFAKSMKRPLSEHFTKHQRHECLLRLASAAFDCENWSLATDASSRYASKLVLTTSAHLIEAKLIHLKCVIMKKNMLTEAEALIEAILENHVIPYRLYNEVYIIEVGLKVMSGCHLEAINMLNTIAEDVQHELKPYIRGLKIFCLVELQRFAESYELAKDFETASITYKIGLF